MKVIFLFTVFGISWFNYRFPLQCNLQLAVGSDPYTLPLFPLDTIYVPLGVFVFFPFLSLSGLTIRTCVCLSVR